MYSTVTFFTLEQVGIVCIFTLSKNMQWMLDFSGRNLKAKLMSVAVPLEVLAVLKKYFFSPD